MDTVFRRDRATGALLNTDKSAVELYKARRETHRSLQTQINSLKEEIDQLRKMVSTLISLGMK